MVKMAKYRKSKNNDKFFEEIPKINYSVIISDIREKLYMLEEEFDKYVRR